MIKLQQQVKRTKRFKSRIESGKEETKDRKKSKEAFLKLKLGFRRVKRGEDVVEVNWIYLGEWWLSVAVKE